MATISSVLASRIPWTEEPGGLRSIGSQRVGLSDQTTKTQYNQKLPYTWKKEAEEQEPERDLTMLQCWL